MLVVASALLLALAPAMISRVQVSVPGVVQLIEFPELAKRALASGTVVLEVKFDPSGVVTGVEEKEGHKLFADAATKEVRKWRFDASLVTSPFLITFVYELDGPKLGEEEQDLTVNEFRPPSTLVIRRVLREPEISRLGLTAEQIAAKRCPLHGVPLKLGVVPIRYGLMTTRDEYEVAEVSLFPYSNQSVGGGCILGLTSKAEVLYCEACRKAEETWVHENSPRLKTLGTLEGIVSALSDFAEDVGRFPTVGEGLDALGVYPDSESWDGPYLFGMDESRLEDAWGGSFYYSPSDDGAQAVVCSWGSDHRPGGEGQASDHCKHSIKRDSSEN